MLDTTSSSVARTELERIITAFVLIQNESVLTDVIEIDWSFMNIFFTLLFFFLILQFERLFQAGYMEENLELIYFRLQVDIYHYYWHRMPKFWIY